MRAPRRGPRPTPRYRDVPRWGLHDVPFVPDSTTRRRSSTAAGMLGALLIGTAGTLFIAGVGQVWLYVLTYLNQSVPVSATQAEVVAYLLFLGGWASLLAVAAAMWVSLWWLVTARADAYAAAGECEPRALWRLVAGWLLPVVNLVFAWVFLRELAEARGASAADLARLRVGYRLWLVCNVFGGVVITIGQVSGSVGFVAEIVGGYAWRANAVGIAAVVDVLAAVVCVLAARELRRPVGVTVPARRWVLAG